MEKSLGILIVDDSQTIRHELKDKFESLGHRVLGEASNGLEALDQIKELSPDVVSLDIIMPEMDGIECYRKMRNLENPPRCVLLSALSDEQRVIETYANEIEVDHYLSKGCSQDDLAEKLDVLLAKDPLPIPDGQNA